MKLVLEFKTEKPKKRNDVFGFFMHSGSYCVSHPLNLNLCVVRCGSNAEESLVCKWALRENIYSCKKINLDRSGLQLAGR